MVSHLSAAVNSNGVYISDDDYNSPDTQAKLQDVIENLDIDHFADTFEMDFGEWGFCGSGVVISSGPTVCFDEPVIVADYSKEPLKIQALGISLNNDISRSGYSRKSLAGSHVFGHTTFLQFPLIGMWMDSKELCLQQGDISIGYLSDFDPLYDGMHTKAAFPDLTQLFQPHLMLLEAVDCAASSAESLTGNLSTVSQYNAKLRMAIPHAFGCWNAFSMGGWATQSDPILAAGTAISYALAGSMRIGLISKSTKISGMDGSTLPDTMCGQKITPIFVKPQFLFNMATPTASKVVPLGAMAPEWATFKNTPDAVDESSYWIWQRKCLYFGAAKCSK